MHSDHHTKRTFRGLFAVNFLICLGLGIADPFFPAYATGGGATGVHLAILFSGYAIAKTVFSPLTGWWSDTGGRCKLLLLGISVYIAASLGYLFSSDPIALIALRFLQGIAAAFVRPISLAFVGDIAPARREGTAMGTFDISFYGAFAVGPILGGAIQEAYGFQGIFLSFFLLCCLAFAVALFYVKSPGNAEEAAAARGADWAVLRKSRLLAALCGFIFTRSFGIAIFTIFMPIYMYDQLKFRGMEIGIIMSASTILIALLLRPMGRLSDRVSRGPLVWIGGTAAALFSCCLPLAGEFAALFGLSVGIGMASVLSLPAVSALLVEEGNRQGMGVTIGIFNGAMNLGFVVAPLIGGIAFTYWGIKPVFYAAGLVGLAGTFFYAVCAMTGAAAGNGYTAR